MRIHSPFFTHFLSVSVSSTLLVIECVMSLSVHIMTCAKDRLRLPVRFPRALDVILIRLRLWAEFSSPASGTPCHPHICR